MKKIFNGSRVGQWSLLAMLLLALCVVLPTVFAPSDAAATIAVKLDVDGLTTSADAVLMGRVKGLQSRWEGSRIITEVEVEVAMPVMGKVDVGQVVKVQVLGGRVGDLAQAVSGTAAFVPGEDVMLFVERPASLANVNRVVGMSQGKYSVVKGPDERMWAVRDLSGLTLADVEPAPDGQRLVARITHEHPEELGAVPVDTLIKEVALSASRVDVAMHPVLLERLGADLSRSYDFSALFEGMDKVDLKPVE